MLGGEAVRETHLNWLGQIWDAQASIGCAEQQVRTQHCRQSLFDSPAASYSEKFSTSQEARQPFPNIYRLHCTRPSHTHEWHFDVVNFQRVWLVDRRCGRRERRWGNCPGHRSRSWNNIPLREQERGLRTEDWSTLTILPLWTNRRYHEGQEQSFSISQYASGERFE